MPNLRAKRALLTELHNVLTTLRQNRVFLHRVSPSVPIHVSVGISLAASSQEEFVFESKLIKELKELRDTARALTDHEFEQLSRVAVIQPFLAVIRSPEASGPFTDAALMALLTFLRTGLFAEGSVHVSEALSEIVDAAAGCRFEETDAQRDEAVRARVLRVLVAALQCPVGMLLTDTAIWEMVNICFINCNELVHTPMLCHSAEEALHTIVGTIFTHFTEMIERSTHSAQSPPRSRYKSNNATEVPEIGGYGLPCCVKVFGFLCSHLLRTPSESTSFVAKTHHNSLRLLCLRLVRVVADTAGPTLVQCSSLLGMVRDDLCHALLRMARTPGGLLECLSESLGVMRCLWGIARKHLKMQFQALFNGIFLRVLAQIKQLEDSEEETDQTSSNSPLPSIPSVGSLMSSTTAPLHAYSEREQEVILEALCDFLAVPSLLQDLFVNYDCDLQSSDILEALFGLLSSCARRSQTGPIAELCMEALLAALRGLYRRCSDPLEGQLQICEKNSGETVDKPNLPIPPTHLWVKKLQKRGLRQGASEFNQKPKTGLTLLQKQGLLPDPLTPKTVAHFLRTAPGLEKQIIGEYLGSIGKPELDPETGEPNFIGDTEAFHEEALKAFVAEFDFKNQPLLAALRMFLAAFRLPGEAQQIDRILQAFANECYLHCQESQTGLFATSDVCFLLSFSLIMLNTDLHNANIKQEKRMTIEQFINQNRNYGVDISKGQDLPTDLLENMYNSIKEAPVSTIGDGPDGQITIDRWRDLMRMAEANDALGMMITSHEEPEGKGNIGKSQDHQSSTQESYDRDILSLIWQPTMWAASQTFSLAAGRRRETLTYRFSTGVLRQSVDVVLLLAKILGHHSMHDAFDSLVYLLCNFTGLLNLKQPPPSNATEVAGDTVGESTQSEANAQANEHLTQLYDFCLSPIAQMATVTVFGIADRLGNHLRQGWRPVIHLLLRMRDLHILPREVLKETDCDLLTPESRRQFNASVLAAMGAHRVKSSTDQRASGFFGWLRGESKEKSTQGSFELEEMWDDTFTDSEEDAVEKPGDQSPIHPLISRTSDEVITAVIDSSLLTAGPTTSSAKNQADDQTIQSFNANPDLPYESFFQDPSQARAIGRRVASKCNLPEVLSGSRFLSPNTLQHFLATLLTVINTSLPEGENGGIASVGEDSWETEFQKHYSQQGSNSETQQEQKGKVFAVKLPPVSRPSLAFAEVLLVEISLRNRDRMGCLWPMLSNHYRQRLHRARKLTFSVEKVATGLLRICTRLMLRANMLATCSEALLWLSPPHLNGKLAMELEPLLGTGVWHVVTNNAACLPQLTPKGWKAIFDLISTCAHVGGEGASKAFEALCFLAHEPQLQECVPISCVGPVSSFVTSSKAQPSLSIAALDLLMVMHFRLEVLFNGQTPAGQRKEEKEKSKEENIKIDQAVLTQSWVPLLKAIALGGRDSRPQVQEHALRLLIQAMGDAHALHISPVLLLQLIQNILVPLARHVFQESEVSVGSDSISRKSSFSDWLIRNTDTNEGLESPSRTRNFSFEEVVLSNASLGEAAGKLGGQIFGRNQILCLTRLCKVFLQYLNSLLPLPAFHELWVKILQVMQIYLGQRRNEIGAEVVSGTDVGFNSVAETALEHLKNILLVMHANGAFKPGDDTIGQELWQLTWAVLENFSFCPNLMLDLFPETDRLTPPDATRDAFVMVEPMEQVNASAEQSEDCSVATMPGQSENIDNLDVKTSSTVAINNINGSETEVTDEKTSMT